jgi:hypothetical protein
VICHFSDVSRAASSLMFAISSLSRFLFALDSSLTSYFLTRLDRSWLTVSWTSAELTISAIRISSIRSIPSPLHKNSTYTTIHERLNIGTLDQKQRLSLATVGSYLRIDHMVKDRKRRPERGEWVPQISSEIFGRCPPKSLPNKSEFPKPRYASQLVTRVSGEIPRSDRKPRSRRKLI